jgi:Putative Actinobacterial Holin-X, holin superfamily III
VEQSSTRSIGNGDSNRSADHSLGELVKQLSDQSTRLARMEVELAKAELTQKGKQIGAGAGAFGGAATVGFYAFGALTAAAILGLSEAVDAWLAALIVAAVYAAMAGVLALVGRNRVEAGTPPLPKRAIESSKEDIETAKRSAKEARV